MTHLHQDSSPSTDLDLYPSAYRKFANRWERKERKKKKSLSDELKNFELFVKSLYFFKKNKHNFVLFNFNFVQSLEVIYLESVSYGHHHNLQYVFCE